MYECYANANPKEKQFWSQEIERINTRTISDRLTKTEFFASRLF